MVLLSFVFFKLFSFFFSCDGPLKSELSLPFEFDAFALEGHFHSFAVLCFKLNLFSLEVLLGRAENFKGVLTSFHIITS